MTDHISVTLRENRSFPPPAGFAARAIVRKEDEARIREEAKRDPEKFWADAARELHWFKPWDRVLEWNPPEAKWFLGGKINASYNCLDRHLKTQATKTALIWEGEPGEVVRWSYAELHAQTERFTALLRKLGLKPGDRVAIYLPMTPEAVVAMLACARGGFTHTVVFGGFSSTALIDRINDAEARLVITADGGYRKGAWIPLKQNVDEAVKSTPSVEKIVTLRRAMAGKLEPGAAGDTRGRELDWHGALATVDAAETRELGRAAELDSEHPLFILYTSGTTGKPKGIVHTTGGFMTGVLQTTRTVFDLRPEDVYWCTADIGWVTGHSYFVYGPLACGATALMYEGAPNHPDAHRIWQIIEKHKATILYTAPTAIRAFMKGGDLPKQHDLSTLRLLGTVGEPINPEAWMWYRDVVGGGRCPIVDTYWQTETGAIVISPLPGTTATKPGSATFALPGYDVEVLDKNGQPVPKGQGGYLVIRKPWPSMARTIFRDPERFKKQYWSEFPGGIYFTGDGARRDEDGYLWCLGRVDDVLNVSGHRLGTMEIESALVSHPWVAEAAVVGRPDDLKGQAVVAFVTLKSAISAGKPDLAKVTAELKAHVSKEIGALARPDDIRLSDSLPKTRSGKIMRRLL
ncbi:MAG TPA: acetate--CoA ligase, partial [Bdellovibrionota bacterium]|nr:acetate--CoA ligase [Bdellovibrionota bacterium]